jgi:hypothetical protein
VKPFFKDISAEYISSPNPTSISRETGTKLTSTFPQRISISKDDQILHGLIPHKIPLVLLIEMQDGVLINAIASDSIVDAYVG